MSYVPFVIPRRRCNFNLLVEAHETSRICFPYTDDVSHADKNFVRYLLFAGAMLNLKSRSFEIISLNF